MKLSRTFGFLAAAHLCLFAAGCSAETSEPTEDTTDVAITSNDGKLFDFTFDAEVVASSSAEARDAIVAQLAYVSRALYAQVFEPVASMLRKPELLIIPDGDLQTVNFETLLFEPADRGKLGAHMLIQKYAIGYLLSATTAVQFKGLAAPGANKVLAFAPGFSDEMKQGYLAGVRDSAIIDRNYLRYVRQPFAVSMAEELGSSLSARVRFGTDASETHFREQAKEYGVLHLGMHAEMNATSPLYSRLVFSKDGSGVDPDKDGYLHAYENFSIIFSFRNFPLLSN